MCFAMIQHTNFSPVSSQRSLRYTCFSSLSLKVSFQRCSGPDITEVVKALAQRRKSVHLRGAQEGDTEAQKYKSKTSRGDKGGEWRDEARQGGVRTEGVRDGAEGEM